MLEKDIETQWTNTASSLMLGRKVTGVRYLTSSEAKDLDWYSRSIVITLSAKGKPDIHVYPSRDDEGNDAGALFTTDEKEPTLPVLPT
jgi:hypothetical protein